jgi:hypothetical protein
MHDDGFRLVISIVAYGDSLRPDRQSHLGQKRVTGLASRFFDGQIALPSQPRYVAGFDGGRQSPLLSQPSHESRIFLRL